MKTFTSTGRLIDLAGCTCSICLKNIEDGGLCINGK